MRGIFFRHVVRELASQTLIIAGVLLAVLVIYQVSFVLGRAADGQIPGGTVPQLVLLSLRTNLGVILPFAVLLGVVMGLGRLYHDSEITAAQAGGLGRAVLFGAAAAIIVPVALMAAWVAFIDGPVAARTAVELRLQALRTAVTRSLVPGSFRDIGSGAILHFTARDADGTLRGVFVQRQLPDDGTGRERLQVVVAERARYQIDAAGESIEVELLDGQSHEGAPGTLDWRITQFGRQLLRLPAPQARLPGPPRTDLLGNRELLGSDLPRLQGELHWRIGWVAAVVVLGLLAVPLARLAPRQGRHARVPLAVLLFAVHAGLLTSGKTLLERGETPALLGLWWVPALVLLLAVVLLGAPRWLAAARRRQAG